MAKVRALDMNLSAILDTQGHGWVVGKKDGGLVVNGAFTRCRDRASTCSHTLRDVSCGVLGMITCTGLILEP